MITADVEIDVVGKKGKSWGRGQRRPKLWEQEGNHVKPKKMEEKNENKMVFWLRERERKMK